MPPSDVTMPLISAPWSNADGNPLSVTPLPGLRSEVIRSLECSYPGILNPPMKHLLGSCCGLAGTEGLPAQGWRVPHPRGRVPSLRAPSVGHRVEAAVLEERPCA